MARKPAPVSDPQPRPDAAARLRNLLGPATLKHLAFKEKLRAHYVTTARDEELASEIESMIENISLRRDDTRPPGDDNRTEGTAVAIIADSGAGKTRAMLHYLKNNHFFPRYGDPEGGCPLITVGVKAPCNLRNLGMATLRAAGYAARTEKRQNEAWPQAQFQIQDQGILIVNYEEAQRIIQQANKSERRQVIETLAGLMTDPVWPLSLILSGLPELAKLFQQDFLDEHATPAQRLAHATLKRRTRFVNFDAVDLKADRKDLDRGVREYSKIGGVDLELLDDKGETRARVLHAAAHQFGLFWELVVIAIDNCVRSGRTTAELDDFADGYAAKTREPTELNPFAVDHWERIDTSIIQHRVDDDDDPPAKKPVTRQRPERRREDS
jgi:AAA domain